MTTLQRMLYAMSEEDLQRVINDLEYYLHDWSCGYKVTLKVLETLLESLRLRLKFRKGEPL